MYLMPLANGVSRRTAAGTMSERRVWKCRDYKKQFSVLTGTMLHATKIPIRTWILVFFDMMADKNGMSVRELERKYGVTPRTAWHMLHRIRQAMGSENKLVSTLRGTIVSDETYVGGNPARMNTKTRPYSDSGSSSGSSVTSSSPRSRSFLSTSSGSVSSGRVNRSSGTSAQRRPQRQRRVDT